MPNARAGNQTPSARLRNATPQSRVESASASGSPQSTETTFGGKGYPVGLLLAITDIASHTISTLLLKDLISPMARIVSQAMNPRIASVVPAVRLAEGEASGGAAPATPTTRYFLLLALTSE